MGGRAVEELEGELRSLVEGMERLMTDALGIGLAATQVGIVRRLFVFQPGEDEVAAVVNPEIVERSEETTVADEGCLSIQGILVPVERALTITLTGRDANGEAGRFRPGDIYARAAPHEV